MLQVKRERGLKMKPFSMRESGRDYAITHSLAMVSAIVLLPYCVSL